jgi:hypothetical protein
MPLNSPPPLAISGRHETFGISHVITPREHHIAEQWHEQVLVMDGTRSKGLFGMEIIADINQCAAAEFVETEAYIHSYVLEAIGTGYEAETIEFATYLRRISARQFASAVEVVGAKIGLELDRTLYPPPEAAPPKPKGFLQRLFGG